MEPREVDPRRRKARVHIELVLRMYQKQLASGAHFLHEQPAPADSWEEDSMQELRMRPGVSTAVGGTCTDTGIMRRSPDGDV